MSLLIAPPESGAHATDVSFDARTLLVRLADGRVFGVPLAHFPRLATASRKELRTWRFIGNGEGIHWPLLDEDVSVERIVAPYLAVEVDLGSPRSKWRIDHHLLDSRDLVA
jgi:hypothetical protein